MLKINVLRPNWPEKERKMKKVLRIIYIGLFIVFLLIAAHIGTSAYATADMLLAVSAEVCGMLGMILSVLSGSALEQEWMGIEVHGWRDM